MEYRLCVCGCDGHPINCSFEHYFLVPIGTTDEECDVCEACCINECPTREQGTASVVAFAENILEGRNGKVPERVTPDDFDWDMPISPISP